VRVGIDVSKARPPRDGIGVATFELLRALAAAERQAPGTVELHLYPLLHPLDGDALAAELGGWPRGWRFRAGADPAADELDLFHATAWYPPPTFRGPLLFTCYDLTFLSHPECHTVANRVHCLEGILRAHLQGAAWTAISHATAAEMARWLSVDASSVTVIHPAAAERFRRLPEGDAERWVAERFGVDGSYLLAVGTREPRKNLPRLIAAHRRLPAELRRTHPLLVAGGAGWGDDVASSPEVDGVRFLDRVGDDDLVALYNGATLFAYPSLAEGFGLPVLEAMACGAPVLTSNVSATAEVAGTAPGTAAGTAPGTATGTASGTAARTVDPADEAALARVLRELLEDPEERARLRRLGLERAAAFSWAETARHTLDLYRRFAA